MKQVVFAIFPLLAFSQVALGNDCKDRFSELLVHGNPDRGAVKIHVTQEIVGGRTSLNYHYSDGKGNGMTEMIEPEADPWSLFIGDNMYMSKDKGKSWSYMNSYDAEKSRSDVKAAMTKDAAIATDVVCGEEELDGTTHEVVEGNYKSTMIGGAAVHEKLWIDQRTGWIAKSYRHLKSSGFESKTTQVIEAAPDFELPNPE